MSPIGEDLYKVQTYGKTIGEVIKADSNPRGMYMSL